MLFLTVLLISVFSDCIRLFAFSSNFGSPWLFEVRDLILVLSEAQSKNCSPSTTLFNLCTLQLWAAEADASSKALQISAVQSQGWLLSTASRLVPDQLLGVPVAAMGKTSSRKLSGMHVLFSDFQWQVMASLEEHSTKTPHILEGLL